MEYQKTDENITCCLMDYLKTDMGHLLLCDGI